MEKKNIYTVDKLCMASTNKVVLNVHCGSFPINKVKFRAGVYADKVNKDFYIDFPVFKRLATDAASGKLFSDIVKEPFTLYTGYEKDGKIISRNLQISYSAPTVFVTISECDGRKTETGAILPVKGAKHDSISVPIKSPTFREMMIYTSSCIDAYLVKVIPKMIDEYADMKFELAKNSGN